MSRRVCQLGAVLAAWMLLHPTLSMAGQYDDPAPTPPAFKRPKAQKHEGSQTHHPVSQRRAPQGPSGVKQVSAEEQVSAELPPLEEFAPGQPMTNAQRRARLASLRSGRSTRYEEVPQEAPTGQATPDVLDQYEEAMSGFSGGRTYDVPDYSMHDGDSCCGDSCCGECGECDGDSCSACFAPKFLPFYARADYIAWWITGDSLPPLVTTSVPGTARPQAGVLGQPGTSVLFGNGRVNDNMRSGGRIVLGWWLDPCSRIEAEWFGVPEAQTAYNAVTDGSVILGRPFFNLRTGAPDANLVAFPNQLRGSIHSEAVSNFMGAGLQGAENLVNEQYGPDRERRIDFLIGFRYLRLSEDLSVSSSLTSISGNGPVPNGTSLAIADNFGTTNNFYGANIGLMSTRRRNRFTWTTIGRMAIGGTTERITINGSTLATTVNGATQNFKGGLLALPTNIGTYHHMGFTVVPQVELKLGFDVTERLRFNVGYDLMYWSRVARPGQHTDTFINTSQAAGQPLVGTPGPRFALHESDLWVVGASFGGEYRF